VSSVPSRARFLLWGRLELASFTGTSAFCACACVCVGVFEAEFEVEVDLDEVGCERAGLVVPGEDVALLVAVFLRWRGAIVDLLLRTLLV
jgi:hypothetical protein